MDIYTLLQSKPHNPHYLHRYIRFINSISETVGEQHHILPKSSDLFPEYESFEQHPWNCKLLSLRQHYIAHLLLWKAYGGKQTIAFVLMSNRVGAMSSRLYESGRTDFSKYMSENNPNADGSHSRHAWEMASSDRRTRQSILMSKINRETKSRPKEFREYECSYCRDTFYVEEFIHRHRRLTPCCTSSCRAYLTQKKRTN